MCFLKVYFIFGVGVIILLGITIFIMIYKNYVHPGRLCFSFLFEAYRVAQIASCIIYYIAFHDVKNKINAEPRTSEIDNKIFDLQMKHVNKLRKAICFSFWFSVYLFSVDIISNL